VGPATAAALAALAKSLGLRTRDVEPASGTTNRTKIVETPDTVADLGDGRCEVATLSWWVSYDAIEGSPARTSVEQPSIPKTTTS
jgi:hypothetical protein